MHKAASITQAKDESSILPHSLDVLGEFVDAIIIIDDNSIDNSVEIIKNHRNKDKIILLQNKEKDRNEGREFNKCLNIARDIGATRIYVSDCDEIAPEHYALQMKNFLRHTNDGIRLKRAELALDQKTVYGLDGGNGKLVIFNIDHVNKFNDSQRIHTSQPPVNCNQYLINENECCLLHYGPSCYASQVYKCFCYTIWENRSINKPYSQGYNEYFKLYRNFVKSGNTNADKYFWNSGKIKSPIQYEKFLPERIKQFCKSIDVFSYFSIEEKIKELLEIDEAKKYILERS